MTDTGWIYSSIIQSTAAFVAIVGGFITGTVLQHIARRNGVADEISETATELKRLQTLRHAAIVERDRWIVSDKLTDEFQSILSHWPVDASLDELQAEFELNEREREAFEAEWEELSGTIDTYWKRIASLVEKHGARSPFFDEWNKSLPQEMRVEDTWESSLIFEELRGRWLVATGQEQGNHP